MKFGAATAVGLAALIAAPVPVPAASRSAAATAPSLCGAGERVVYSCQFGRKLGSICVGRNSIHYRFGLGRKPEIDLSSRPDWSNVHLGGNRSQAGLNQDHIRFTNSGTHYVIHAGETGSLNEEPGRRFSGIVVLQGTSAQTEVARLDCKAGRPFDRGAFDSISDAAPKGWDGSEDQDGPFDAIY